MQGFIVFSTATASHTLLDYVMTESRGVALWWPFTDQRYRLRVPNQIDYTWDDSSLWHALPDILQISFGELIVFTPVLLLVILVRRYLRGEHKGNERVATEGHPYI